MNTHRQSTRGALFALLVVTAHTTIAAAPAATPDQQSTSLLLSVLISIITLLGLLILFMVTFDKRYSVKRLSGVDARKSARPRVQQRAAGFFSAGALLPALRKSICKLSPVDQIKNPVMFTVWVGTVLMVILLIQQMSAGVPWQFTFLIALLLLITVLFGNFAEAIAEQRGKAQAESLRKTRTETNALKVSRRDSLEGEVVPSTALRKGDLVRISTGEIIPTDGEIISGIATVDESAITGESAPVIREAGGDRSSVTGGTRVLTDSIVVEVSANPGETFLDRMISLVEGAKRKKTPNELALTILLSFATLIFVIVCVTLYIFGEYFQASLNLASLTALLVCLIPTTIGALLSAIGIAGIDRAMRANVIAKSGRAVEIAGDIDVLLLDKTGTITIGNRKATRIIPIGNASESEALEIAALASLYDPTPEGKSIVELATALGSRITVDARQYSDILPVEFTAQTRMSGADLPDGTRLRKGATDTIRKYVEQAGGPFPPNVDEITSAIASNGGTPLILVRDHTVLAVIQLQDVLKEGMHERFDRLRAMGLKTVMITGDNPLTAAYIAKQAGVDDYVAEATPEGKLEYIRKEQAAGKLVAMMGDGTNDAPALAQADVAVAMNSGTQAAKEAGNMVDLDNDPTKLIEVVEIGKQLLMTRGALTTFSIANDVAKYFAIIPAIFAGAIPALSTLNIMHLASPQSAVLSATIFNALVIPLLIPIALKGVKYHPVGAQELLKRNVFIYGLGGVLVPFFAIKIIDMLLALTGFAGGNA